MNTIRILSSNGDNTYQYNPETQLEEATAKFNELKCKGYTMFAVDLETKETELIENLFKNCPQVIAVPQISGG
jgi:hypothetical protein